MTRDQFLTEWLKECWHEWEWVRPEPIIGFRLGQPLKPKSPWWKCSKCSKEVYSGASQPRGIDFSTAKGFFKLWNVAKKNDSFGTFLYKTSRYSDTILIDLVGPPVFADAWAKFLGWPGEDNDEPKR